MSSLREWYTEKISNLLQEDVRVSTLSELRDHLKSLSHEEASRIVTDLQLLSVFDCLNNSNAEQVDLACEVLSICFDNLHLGESTHRYKSALERALAHPFPVVKLLALKEIERSLSNEETLGGLCNETPLLVNVVSCIGDNDLGVANKASNIMVALGITAPGANKIATNEIIIAIQNTMAINDIVKLRIYEMIVNISKESGYGFNKFKSVGLISKLLDELESKDVLLKLNIIEILSQLVQSEEGYMYLDENGVLQKIFALINEDELTSQLCEPGILKFFGQIGNRKSRELLAKYPQLFDRLFANIESSDLTIIGVSLDTIGLIGQTSQGKLALESTGVKIEGCIRTISRMLVSLPTETRVRALYCLENLLRDNRYDIMQITEKWFHLLGPDPMDVITKYAKNPFTELRLAGFGLIDAIASQLWGQQTIKNTPGLIEFLLDRGIETTKEGKEAKYEIIKLLSQSTIFDKITRERFEAFIKEGPFYVQAAMEVAIEGN